MTDGFSVMPEQFQVALAPRGPYPDSFATSAGLDPHGNLLASQYEAPHRMKLKYKQTYFTCSQGATAWTVGLATAYTGVCLSNPAASTKNLCLLRAGFILSAGPTAISAIALAQGWSVTAVVHTTPLVVCDGLRGLATTQNWGVADASATLPVAPVYRQWIMGGFTAGAMPAPTDPHVNPDGLIEIPAGGFLIIACPAAITTNGMGYLEWSEIDP